MGLAMAIHTVAQGWYQPRRILMQAFAVVRKKHQEIDQMVTFVPLILCILQL